MLTETVVRLFSDRRFGFIEADDWRHGDVFFHFNHLEMTDRKIGVRVRFEIAQNESNGKNEARSVRRIGETNR